MRRRQFLKTVGAGAPASLVVTGSSAGMSPAAKRESKRRKEPRVFLFDDGRHAADLYCFEPPVTPADHAAIVDQLAGSGADTLVYFAGTEGGTVLYDSKVCQLWGDEVKKWTHYVWYRAAKVLRQLIRDGHDPLKVLCDRCHQTGLFMIASAWVCVQGGTREKNEGLGRKSAFAMDNPRFQVGEDPDPRAPDALGFADGSVAPVKNRFNFLHPEVRRERFLLFQELLTRYETDGIELNLTWGMPFCRFGQVGELAPVMTRWLRDLRKVADEAGQSQGRSKRIYARIPAHPEAWKLGGYEVPTWVSEKLVDGLFCESSQSEEEGLDQDVDLGAVVKLARGTGCRVYSVFHNGLGRPLARYATPSMIWAGAANAWDQGVDGFGIGDHLWAPNGWPWTAQEYETLRPLGHPKLLETADKVYLAHSNRRPDAHLNWLPGRSQPLPQKIKVDRPVQVSFHVADRLHHWHKLGRVKSVVLRVRFGNLIPNYDRVEVEFNRQVLPESILQKVDMTYRLVGPPSSSHSLGTYGYAYDYHLGPEHFPRKGRNLVKVKLLKRDPDVAFEPSVARVDCKIEYRLHRHFEQRPIEY